MLMRSVRLSAILALLVCGNSISFAQEDAKAIIHKAIKAANMPGDNKAYHETWKEKGVMKAMGQEFPYDSKWAFEAPGKYRFDMKAKFGGQDMEISFVQNGAKAKETGMGQSRMLEGPKLEETTHSAYQFWVCSLRPLVHEDGFKLSVSPNKDFAGKKVTSVKVAKDGKRDITLHFDKETDLLVGCTDKVKDEFQEWKEVAQDSEFSGYQKGANGEMQFTKMVVKRDGKVLIESELTGYQRSTVLNPDFFKLD